VTFKKPPFFLFFVSGCGCAAKALVLKWAFKLEISRLKHFTFSANQQKIYGTAKAVILKKPPFFVFRE